MDPAARAPVPVFFYGDYGCPFTYVADRSLTALADERPLSVRWRPLATGPDAVPTAASGAADPEAGTGPGTDRWAGVRGELEAAAAELGLPLRLPDFPVDSREALQAAEFARDLEGRPFPPLHAALFAALFVRGRDIGRRPVLLEVAVGAGVDREALEGALDDGRYEAELDAAAAEAGRYGIGGTPAFLFGRFKLLGAAPLSEMRRAARMAAGE